MTVYALFKKLCGDDYHCEMPKIQTLPIEILARLLETDHTEDIGPDTTERTMFIALCLHSKIKTFYLVC